MDFPPIALLPCQLMLSIAGLLLPTAARTRWKDEWFAEVWHRWRCAVEKDEADWGNLRELYAICWGSFRDAWWHFAERGDGREQYVHAVRSPRFMLIGLIFLLCGCVIGTGFIPATRKIMTPLPYAAGDRIAVISRAGRLEPVRKGVPVDLSERWRKESRLLEGAATCSFPARTIVTALDGKHSLLSITVSPNLFAVLGVAVDLAEAGTKHHGILIADTFWRTEFGADRRVVGQTLERNGEELRIAGVLPAGFWFLSPEIAFYEVDATAVPVESMVVVRAKPGVTADELEGDLAASAKREGFEFSQTAPHAILLRDATKTPLWLFGAAVFVAMVLVALAHGSRWLRMDDARELVAFKSWRGWAFFLAKTGLALLIVLLLGIELFVGRSQQTVSEALGGPALIWFYMVACSLVLFASISDQRSRCRVCQRLLAFPIRIGCPGCLFLDWAGTEFLCPQGHGALYVPHHVSCWEEEDRWILLEA